MDSKFLLTAARAKFPMGALVPEVSIPDEYMRQAYIASLPESTKRFYAKMVDSDYEENPEFDLSNGKFVRRIDGLLLVARAWTALEAKISRQDFFRDTFEKRKVWIDHTNRFVYLTPEGLVQPNEVPKGCGLWEVSENRRVTVKKRATINHSPKAFPDHMVRNLFYRLSNFEKKKALSK